MGPAAGSSSLTAFGWLQRPLQSQYLVKHDLLAHRRIEHGVIHRPIWPSNVEVFLHKRRPIVVDRIDQLVYLSLGDAGCCKATHLVAPRCVQKDAHGVASVAEEVLRP